MENRCGKWCRFLSECSSIFPPQIDRKIVDVSIRRSTRSTSENHQKFASRLHEKQIFKVYHISRLSKISSKLILKIDQKTNRKIRGFGIKKRSKIDPKSIQNRSKIDENWSCEPLFFGALFLIDFFKLFSYFFMFSSFIHFWKSSLRT